MKANAFYEVAYDEAVRALSEQQAAVDGLRSRTGVLFSVAAVTTSFLGAQALASGEGRPLVWLALAAFACVAATLLAVLWPRRWEFTANPHAVAEALVEYGDSASVADLHRWLSSQMHRSYLENRQAQESLFVYVRVATVLFVLELALWISAIAIAA